MKNSSCALSLQIIGFSLLTAIAPWVAAQTPSAAGHPPPATAPGADPAPPITADQASYLFGLSFGAQMRSVGIGADVPLDPMMRGMKDGLQGRQPTQAEMLQVQAYVHTIMQA